MTVTRDSHVTSGVTFAVSHRTPSRPVPTRPISVVATASISKTKRPTHVRRGERFGIGGKR